MRDEPVVGACRNIVHMFPEIVTQWKDEFLVIARIGCRNRAMSTQ